MAEDLPGMPVTFLFPGGQMLTLRHIGPLIRKQKKANAVLGLLAPLLVHVCVVYAIASVSMSIHARVEARG